MLIASLKLLGKTFAEVFRKLLHAGLDNITLCWLDQKLHVRKLPIFINSEACGIVKVRSGPGTQEK